MASSDSPVGGYRVYYGSAAQTYNQTPGNGINTGNTTSFTITGLQPGTLYYFAVTSIDAAGHDSRLSNEATVIAK